MDAPSKNLRADQVILGATLAALCALAGFGLRGQTQARDSGASDRVFQLAEEKIQVSKLDWILLTARVRVMEQILAHESSRPTALVGMRYAPERKRVIAKAFVKPDWIDRAKMDEVKKVLLEQALGYCVDGLGMSEAEAGEVLASMNMGKDCSVDFFTWTVDKTGKLQPKELATEEGGQLILK